MAIDSEIKRVSALHFVGHRHGRLLPDGAISGADRQDAVGFYRAITALLFTVTLASVSVTQPTVSSSVDQPSVAASVSNPSVSITVKNDIT